MNDALTLAMVSSVALNGWYRYDFTSAFFKR
jgi:hypothetical protein